MSSLRGKVFEDFEENLECPSSHNLIRFLVCQTSSAESKEIEEHLASCMYCAKELFNLAINPVPEISEPRPKAGVR